jgi:hypothetical protein
MTGIQDIPFRIPEKWDPEWFRQFIRDVLAPADARNSLGVGISVSGSSSTVATLSNETLDNSFVAVAANPNLESERILAVDGGLSLTDNGPNLTIVVSVLTNGLVLNKIQQIATDRFLGRITAATGDIEELTATQATSMLDAATTLLQGLVKQSTAVTDLNQVISNPPTQAEVQAISDKVDELLGVMRTSGQLA